MDDDDYKNIYEDFSGWLKFIEAKNLAFLTIQLGALYAILKLQNVRIGLTSVAFLVSIFILLTSLIPRIDKTSKNVVYFGSWIDKDTAEISKLEKSYKTQCKDIALVISKKSKKFRYSLFIFILAILYGLFVNWNIIGKLFC
ncbi:hypothetical protein BG261_08635 [Floricoccus tropicus]|uniref:Pycsar effector protein domain-containing protein n=1 Tax=Floricoccus tropicus TaxID=1859473 RepID=A0A1E8GLE2_9LACT|nr:hypothetical protein [Floricoccus tropicus]OFI48338.1 hypothetical protein BG261_08635 [Floricoccus tropicus]